MTRKHYVKWLRGELSRRHTDGTLEKSEVFNYPIKDLYRRMCRENDLAYQRKKEMNNHWHVHSYQEYYDIYKDVFAMVDLKAN